MKATLTDFGILLESETPDEKILLSFLRGSFLDVSDFINEDGAVTVLLKLPKQINIAMRTVEK